MLQRMFVPISQRKSRGFTLTELAIVLSIIGVILGAIWSAASRVYANRKSTATVQEVLNIVEGIHAKFPGATLAGGAQNLNSLAMNSNIITADETASCTGLVWGTAYGTNSAGNCAITPYNTSVIVGTQGGYFGFAVKTNAFEIGLDFSTAPAGSCGAVLSTLISQGVNGGNLINVSYNATIYPVSTTTAISSFTSCDGTQVGLQYTL